MAAKFAGSDTTTGHARDQQAEAIGSSNGLLAATSGHAEGRALTPSAIQADALDVLPPGLDSRTAQTLQTELDTGHPNDLIDAELPQAVKWERQLGDSELSYYLPSRQMGINDM